jgi:hypothetical protein
MNGDGRLTKISPKHEHVKFCDTCADFLGKNVFIIILESFSAEYIGALDAEFKEFPNMIFFLFLDSLINRSYIFERFANGTTSIDELMSIRLSIPPLFDVSYIRNAYAGNVINSLVSNLKKD